MKKNTIRLTETELKRIIKDVVKEAYETVNYKHFDNDPKRYDSYVLVSDGDGSVIYNYNVWPGDFWKEVLDEAIEDANELASKNKYGSYSVYGCENNVYDDNTLVYSTDNEINESKKIVKEASNSQVKKKYINLIYKAVKEPLSGIHHDDNWSDAFYIFDVINDALGKDWDIDVWCENGGYWKQITEFPNYKEYKLKITSTTGIEINGSLKCHSAGTMEDPFSRYDMTLTLY